MSKREAKARSKQIDKELKEEAKARKKQVNKGIKDEARSKQIDKELRRDKDVTDNSIKILILGEDQVWFLYIVY